MTTRKQTPSQTVGPWFAYGLTPEAYGREGLATGVIAGPEIAGQRMTLSGRVLDASGHPLPDAMLEIWQANAGGRYAHPADSRTSVPLQAGFTGFGRVSTNPEGRYHFSTIKPGRVPAGGAARGNVLQAPHLNLIVFARGLLSHLYTRVYFSDEGPANAEDPVLGLIEPSRRPTLVAQRTPTGDGYTLDINLQGENETVFFEA